MFKIRVALSFLILASLISTANAQNPPRDLQRELADVNTAIDTANDQIIDLGLANIFYEDWYDFLWDEFRAENEGVVAPQPSFSLIFISNAIQSLIRGNRQRIAALKIDLRFFHQQKLMILRLIDENTF